MGSLTDAIAAFDLIDRIEGVVSSFLNADWKGARNDAGISGVVAEFSRTLSGANRWTFLVPRDCGCSGGQIEQFLRHYGIKVWGRGIMGPDYYFSVKERQANWAEYLLLRRGLPLAGTLYNPENKAYGRVHAPGDRPPAWQDSEGRPSGGLFDQLDQWLD